MKVFRQLKPDYIGQIGDLWGIPWDSDKAENQMGDWQGFQRIKNLVSAGYFEEIHGFRKPGKVKHSLWIDDEQPPRKRRHNVTYKLNREQAFERDGHRCLKCGATEDLTGDHILPVSKGGSNDLDNLQTLCRKCNLNKGGKTKDYRRFE